VCGQEPCYPVYTAEGCMKPWQVRALGVFTLALAACWLPFAAAAWAARAARGAA